MKLGNEFRSVVLPGAEIRRACVEAFVEQGDFEAAREILEDMKTFDAGMEEWVRAFVTYVKALAITVRFEEARQTINLLDKEPEFANSVARVLALIEFAVALERAGDARAPNTFQEAAMIAENAPPERRASLYQRLARAHAIFCRYKLAFSYLSHCSFHDFIKAIAEGSLDLERLRPDLTARLLRHYTEIATWARPEWQRIVR